MTTRKPKANTEATQAVTEDQPTEAPTFATEFFKGAGIPYCETCGEQLRTNPDNSPICPIKKAGCDRNTPES